MAFLNKYRKSVLIEVAEELGETISESMIVQEIKCTIKKSKYYVEEDVELICERIRKEKELEQVRREKELEQVRREKELEKLERIEKLKLEQAYELEKLRITTNVQNNGENINEREIAQAPRVDLHRIMGKFEGNDADLGLFLSLFENQVSMVKIPKEYWVTQLLSLIPLEMAQYITRENINGSYEDVKELLLSKFKLSPEKFRVMFYRLQRNSDERWEDMRYRLSTYLSEWLGGNNIITYDALKDMLIAEQMKRKVPNDVKEHFIDSWAKLNDSKQLAKKLDEYEIVSSEFRKPNRNQEFQKNRAPDKTKVHYPHKGNNYGDRKPVNTGSSNGDRKPFHANGNNGDKPPFKGPKTDFYQKKSEQEKPFVPTCYACNEKGHLSYNCPSRSGAKKAEHVSNVSAPKAESSKYIQMGKVNNCDVRVWRDSGATIDLVSEKYVNSDAYTGETVWVQQPLDESPVCLPIVKVTLEIPRENAETVTIVAKAAVIRKQLDKGYYLLGNETAERIERRINNEPDTIEIVSNVVTRSQSARAGAEIVPSENGESDSEDETEFELPCVVADETLQLLNVSRDEFRKEQEGCSTLAEIRENLDKGSNYFLNDQKMLVKSKINRLGDEMSQIVVPLKYRNALMELCHEAMTCHVGVTKTKDKLCKHYFWPGCYKDIEEYVRTCDVCQRVGHPTDARKAPLKLVPVIEEIFSRINVDLVGPMKVSEKGNRYLLTAICEASRYPEAIPLADISSESVVKALLEIFCRIGFPKEVKFDNGAQFSSQLTTQFLNQFNIQVRHSSVYHPQSNMVERFHRSLKRILSMACNDAGEGWEGVLPMALFTLRNVVHETTGFSPAEMIFGENLRTPELMIYENWKGDPDNDTPKSVLEYVFQLRNRLAQISEIAVDNSEQKRAKQKELYDRTAVDRQLCENDLVLVLRPSRKNKLIAKWQGPGKVMRKISDTNYIVKMPNDGEREHIYHINMLKKYFQRTENINYIFDANGIPEVGAGIQSETIKVNLVQGKGHSNLNKEQLKELMELIEEYSDIFSMSPGLSDIVCHDIELNTEVPVRSKPYKMSPRQEELVDQQVNDMIEKGIIIAAESDYTSPAILVEVAGREPRLCIDYRRLNEITKTKYYPLPNIEQRIEAVAKAKYITLIDLAKGYWQIKLTDSAQNYAAFVTTKGTFKPLRMSFGLKNAPYFFSRLMDQVLRGCENYARPYIDDTAIFSDSWADHVIHLREVFNRLRSAKLTVKPTKCQFAQETVEYLGHQVGQGKLTPTDAKVEIVRNLKAPSTKKQVRSLLGFVNYYRRYVNGISQITAPLTDLLKGKVKQGKITWTDECEKSLCEIKKCLTSAPVLYAPDASKQFILQCDASRDGIGICLAQRDEEGEEHPVLFLSKKFTETERNFCTSEQECMAIIYGVKKLQYYLDNGIPFLIQTDHNALVWLKTTEKGSAKLRRWALMLQEFNFEIEHRKGRNHQNADFLSRYPFIKGEDN